MSTTTLQREIVDRFPQFEDVVDRLLGSHIAFEALCQEYAAVLRDLGQTETNLEAAAQSRSHELRKRMAFLERELVMLMEANVRL